MSRSRAIRYDPSQWIHDALPIIRFRKQTQVVTTIFSTPLRDSLCRFWWTLRSLPSQPELANLESWENKQDHKSRMQKQPTLAYLENMLSLAGDSALEVGGARIVCHVLDHQLRVGG